MSKIFRAQGITESERFLIKLADSTFLDLWSYANPFKDQKAGKTGDGKELCDLLVIFGSDVVIFSDKDMGWSDHHDIHIAWKRWFKKAIQKSADQIYGAERWIKEFPDRIFTDKECTQRIPINLPSVGDINVHRVCVATGYESAAREYFNDPDSAFIIMSHVENDDHINEKSEFYKPFHIGNVNTKKGFVHVFDQNSFSTIMKEFDTAPDFISYLTQREAAIDKKKIAYSSSEADLAGFYIKNSNPEKGPNFEIKKEAGDGVFITSGVYQDLKFNPSYIAAKKANEVSYNWDYLISSFTSHIINDTAVAVTGELSSARDIEQALRRMAAEDRFSRRGLSSLFIEAIDILEAQSEEDKFSRSILPQRGEDFIYTFLISRYSPEKFNDSYQNYRLARIKNLEVYCLANLQKYKSIKNCVGIALDCRKNIRSGDGGSQDLIMIQVDEWDEQFEKEVNQMKEDWDVFAPGRLKMSSQQTAQFPEVERKPRLSRQQRRALERQAKKGRKI